LVKAVDRRLVFKVGHDDVPLDVFTGDDICSIFIED
jgi:hypothetical protein